ncbi:MAG TPA: sensor histidine kinase, partial [Ktedonobacterales bacterium]
TLAKAYPIARVPVALLSFVGSVAFIVFLYTFPDGRFIPRWVRWIAAMWVTQQVTHYFFPGSWADIGASAPSLQIALWGVFLVSVVYAQTVRYRRAATPTQRQQTKWVVYGIGVALLGLLIGDGILFALVAGRRTVSPSQLAAVLVVEALVYLGMLLIPLSLAFALLRYRLFQVDIVISRTLTYAALTAIILGLYIIIVGTLGYAVQAQGNLVISLIATAIIAVLFQPLRLAVQRGANRLLFGQRDEPYAVLSQLGQRIEVSIAPEAVLPTIVETVASALKLPYVAISQGQGDTTQVVAQTGQATGPLTRIPLVYQSAMEGEFLLASRAPGESFAPADRRLVEDIGREVAMALYAVRVTADLRAANRELRHSRALLVTAREEERRRLRRDLHDGLGSALTGVSFKLGAAQNLLADASPDAEKLVGEVKGQVQSLVADVRRVVYDLRPPTLDELGLLAAIRERASAAEMNGAQVRVEAATLPPLPAAIETAAYRIALEALANVARHAQAQTCVIALAVEDDHLALRVEDDGVGLAKDARAGVGLSAMRERAAELGGVCVVTARPQGGTCVTARLPLLEDGIEPQEEPAS